MNDLFRGLVFSIMSTLAICTLSGCSLESDNASDCSRDYWVATDGDDNANNGSKEKPFKTIDKARLAVRSDPAKGQCTINVNIKSGTYQLTTPLLFDAQDSGSDRYQVVYRAAPGDMDPVIISGGITINFNDCDGSNCTANASEMPDNKMPRQFYAEGKRAIRARSNYDPSLAIQAANMDYARVSNGYAPAPGQSPPSLSHPEWAEVITATQWKMMRCPISGANGATLIVEPQCWNNANSYPEPWNFQTLNWIENAPEYLTHAGMWFLNPSSKTLQYKPRAGSMSPAGVLPVLDTLINLVGQSGNPVANITFKNLQFSYATWYGPNSIDGYVSDQSGNFLKGTDYTFNMYGHQKVVYPTPGNINLQYAKNITFDSNVFSHLGAVGLWLGTGSQYNLVANNTFTDISSSAIQVGGVSQTDMRPDSHAMTVGNQILNNDISYTGRDYFDSAGIYVGFTADSMIKNNSISHTPWSGIAIGWGWGLFDEGGFPGLPHAAWNEWGTYTTPTVASNNKIVSNKISYFLEQLWDGGAIYVNGSQGPNYENGLLLQLNVAENKRPGGGSNVYYTDGGSQFVTLDRNVSINNPVGYFDFGSCATPSTWASAISDWIISRFGSSSLTDPIIAYFNQHDALCSVTPLHIEYGAEMGGCVPRGNLRFTNNYFPNPDKFFDPCTTNLSVPSTIPNLSITNIGISAASDVPAAIIQQAGKQ